MVWLKYVKCYSWISKDSKCISREPGICWVISDFPPYLKMVSIGNLRKYNIIAHHSIQLERWIWKRFGKCPYFPETDLESTVNPGKLTWTARFCWVQSLGRSYKSWRCSWMLSIVNLESISPYALDRNQPTSHPTFIWSYPSPSFSSTFTEDTTRFIRTISSTGGSSRPA